MLRVHFSADDLARVRLESLGPLAELQLALTEAQRAAGGALFAGWRRRVRATLSADARKLAGAWALPRRNLDLYTTVGASADLPGAVDRILSGSPRLLAELPLYPAAFRDRQPGWAVMGIGGDREAAVRLDAAVASAHATALAPYWERVRAVLTAEWDHAARRMASLGVEGLLAGLGAWARWRPSPSVLEVDFHPLGGMSDLYLRGRGLALVPSFFAVQAEVFVPSGDGEPVLICPAVRDPLRIAEVFGVRRRSDAALAALLGRTRAAVLEAAAEGATTGQVARRLGVAASSASTHAAVLRDAGLITSRRDGGRVWHLITPVGRQLLDRSWGGAG